MRSDLYMAGAHEPASLVSGGENKTEALIELPRLSKGASLPVYILTPEEVSLEEGSTFFVSSRETPGVSGTGASTSFIVIAAIDIGGLGGILGALIVNAGALLRLLQKT